MSSRLLTFAITAAVLLAGSLVALKEGWLNGWKMKVTELVSQSGPPYTEARFRIDLVDQINYARTADKMSALRVDPEMEKWLSSKFESMDLADLNKVTSQVQDGMPRYFRVSVCAASSPSLKELLQRFHEYVHRDQPEMTHLAVAVRPRAAGIMHEALVVIGQRLNDFTPEALTHAKENTPFFSVCVHCKQPHFMSLSNQQRSMALECPKCRKKYAVIAADSKGRFRYVNEFLTGYSPPAVFPKNESRVQQLFTIWSAVHTNCRYTNDPGVKKSEGMYAKKEQLDSWQFADETQRLLRGDCEDSSIYLADWLMSRGFQVRVALGRYGDMGGHAWCVVKIEDREYLIESASGKATTGQRRVGCASNPALNSAMIRCSAAAPRTKRPRLKASSRLPAPPRPPASVAPPIPPPPSPPPPISDSATSPAVPKNGASHGCRSTSEQPHSDCTFKCRRLLPDWKATINPSPPSHPRPSSRRAWQEVG